MSDAFLVVVCAGPTADGRPDPAASRPSAPPRGQPHRRSWTSTDGRVACTVWSATDEPRRLSWSVDGEGALTFLTGQAWRPGRRWSDGPDWAAEVATLVDRRRPASVGRELRGIFAAVHLSPRGDGVVLTDPLGMRCLYIGERDNRLVVASTAALAADALADPSRPAPRHPGAGCWLAFGSYLVGSRTGYQDVRVVAPGESLVLDGGASSWVPADLGPRPDGESLEAVADAVIDEVADGLRAALSRPASRHLIQLTGGKDSRLVLAVAAQTGLADEFAYETNGPPGLADVQVAGELAELLGLRHEARFIGTKSPIPYRERLGAFVEGSAGMINGADLGATIGTDEVRVTGIGGEMLRRFRRVAPGRERRIENQLPRSRFGRLGLVDPEHAVALHAEVLEGLATIPQPDADPLDRLHFHYLQNRMRFTRLGPREELDRALRIRPLCSGPSLRAALALDGQDRQSELLLAEIMRRGPPALVAHRFAGEGWDARAQAHLAARGVLAGPTARPSRAAGAAPTIAPAPPMTPGRDTSLVEELHSKVSNERTAVVAQLLADRSNPAWEVLDRAVASSALERWSDLTNMERRELLGATTTALWMVGPTAPPD